MKTRNTDEAPDAIRQLQDKLAEIERRNELERSYPRHWTQWVGWWAFVAGSILYLIAT